ncbi:MAG: hypothetical protein R3A12_07215 [Ignavibacteria bacterium]
MEKLNEMDEFLKLRNIYKMELAKGHYNENDPESEHESDSGSRAECHNKRFQ